MIAVITITMLADFDPAAARHTKPQDSFDSAAYWEQRYKGGGNSGAGSNPHSKLAQYKAEFLQEFVRTRAIVSVAEFGAGDGNQLLLTQYPSHVQYTGLDVSATAINKLRACCQANSTRQFYTVEEWARNATLKKMFDLCVSLDVIYHLVEDSVFEAYMRRLFDHAGHFVVVYSSNVDHIEARHVRHRAFTQWVASNRLDWVLEKHHPNPRGCKVGTAACGGSSTRSFSDFFVFERASPHRPVHIGGGKYHHVL